MSDFHVAVGNRVTFSKTVGETDVYSYAGITGDFSDNHVNEAFMAGTSYGRRIAHGALMVGFMSTASTKLIYEHAGGPAPDETPVSLGYDRIRFIGAVYFGDTVTVNYEVVAIDPVKRRSTADVTVTNQHGQTVTVGSHILKWVPVAVKDAAK